MKLSKGKLSKLYKKRKQSFKRYKNKRNKYISNNQSFRQKRSLNLHNSSLKHMYRIGGTTEDEIVSGSGTLPVIPPSSEPTKCDDCDVQPELSVSSIITSTAPTGCDICDDQPEQPNLSSARPFSFSSPATPTSLFSSRSVSPGGYDTTDSSVPGKQNTYTGPKNPREEIKPRTDKSRVDIVQPPPSPLPHAPLTPFSYSSQGNHPLDAAVNYIADIVAEKIANMPSTQDASKSVPRLLEQVQDKSAHMQTILVPPAIIPTSTTPTDDGTSPISPDSLNGVNAEFTPVDELSTQQTTTSVDKQAEEAELEKEKAVEEAREAEKQLALERAKEEDKAEAILDKCRFGFEGPKGFSIKPVHIENMKSNVQRLITVIQNQYPDNIEQIKTNTINGNQDDASISKLRDTYLSDTAKTTAEEGNPDKIVSETRLKIINELTEIERKCMNSLFRDYSKYYNDYVSKLESVKIPQTGNSLEYALLLPDLTEDQLAQNVAKLQAGIELEHVSVSTATEPIVTTGGNRKRSRTRRYKKMSRKNKNK